MNYNTKRRTFLQQLNAIARRAHQWAAIKPISFNDKRGPVVHHTGVAY